MAESFYQKRERELSVRRALASLRSGSAAAGSAATVEVNVASAATSGKFSITDAGIYAASKVHCWQAPGPYTGKGTRADEAQMQVVRVTAVVQAAGSAIVYWEAAGHVAGSLRIGKARGNIKFSYVIFS